MVLAPGSLGETTNCATRGNAFIIYHITGREPASEQLIAGEVPAAGNTAEDAEHPHRAPTELGADLTMQTQALTTYMDITVTCALNAAAMEGGLAVATPGTAANIAEHNKRRKYSPVLVTPLVQEAHGRWGQEALTLLRKLTATLPPTEISPVTADVMQ